jgi:GDPmannose 4,6-dehydratase
MSIALVTGVSGQDGRLVARRLSDRGLEVHGVFSEGAGAVPEVDGVATSHSVDLGRPGIGALIASLRPDLVINLAAISSIFRSWREPLATAAINGLAVAEMLAALDEQRTAGGNPRFIQASSADMFGNAAESPQTESTPLRPVSPYGAAKTYAHHLTGVYRAAGLWASTVILYNHESPDRPDTFVTRKITKAAARIALGLQDSLEIGALDTRRDWGWASDFVDAILLVYQHDEPDDYIVATGEDHSIEDFVRIAFEHAGVADWRHRIRLSAEFARPVDPSRSVGDATRARTVLGWKPTVSFEEIVQRMVDHDLECERTSARTAR